MTRFRHAAVFLAFVLVAVAPAGAQERILLFVSDVVIERSGDLLVTETIRVQAEGKDIRRGILRDLPGSFFRETAWADIGYKIESVTRNGQPENFTSETKQGTRVRIGNADVMLPHGQHEYTIRYRTTPQIRFLQDMDALHWNATGYGWPFTIEVAEARITLPQKTSFRDIQFFTGPVGPGEKDVAVVDHGPGRIVFRTTKPLPPENALNVGVGWRKGVVDPPSIGGKGVVPQTGNPGGKP